MTNPHRPQLRRSLGFWALVFYGVGDILGAGIYALVGKVAGVAGSASWAAFAVALLVAGLTALTYAELGGRFPRSAGESFFTEQAFGRPSLALLVGWVVLCSGILSLATVSVAFGGYMSGLVPGLPPSVTVVGILLLLAAINFRGMRESSTTNIIATMVELTGLLIVIIVGALFLAEDPQAGVSETIAASSEVSWDSIARGAALSFFAFIGFEDMVNVAEEVKDPERNMPRAILIALVVTGFVYLLVVVIATSVVPPAVLEQSEAPLLAVVQRSTDAVPDRLFSLIALFAVANTGLLNFRLAAVRLRPRAPEEADAARGDRHRLGGCALAGLVRDPHLLGRNDEPIALDGVLHDERLSHRHQAPRPQACAHILRAPDGSDHRSPHVPLADAVHSPRLAPDGRNRPRIGNEPRRVAQPAFGRLVVFGLGRFGRN